MAYHTCTDLLKVLVFVPTVAVLIPASLNSPCCHVNLLVVCLKHMSSLRVNDESFTSLKWRMKQQEIKMGKWESSMVYMLEVQVHGSVQVFYASDWHFSVVWHAVHFSSVHLWYVFQVHGAGDYFIGTYSESVVLLTALWGTRKKKQDGWAKAYPVQAE